MKVYNAMCFLLIRVERGTYGGKGREGFHLASVERQWKWIDGEDSDSGTDATDLVRIFSSFLIFSTTLLISQTTLSLSTISKILTSSTLLFNENSLKILYK
jgi:hypothetical protein